MTIVRNELFELVLRVTGWTGESKRVIRSKNQQAVEDEGLDLMSETEDDSYLPALKVLLRNLDRSLEMHHPTR